MNSRFPTILSWCAVGFVLLGGVAPRLPAGTSLWSTSADGLWETPGNWVAPLPFLTNSVSLNQGGSYTAFITNSTADSYASMLAITNLTLGNTSDDAPRVLVNYTNPGVVFRIATALTLGTGGSKGIFEVASGAVQVDGNLRLGSVAAAQDLLLIRGGSVTSTNYFQTAFVLGSTSTVIVAEGGTLCLTNRGGTINAAYAGIGTAGYGTLLVSGGTVRVQNKPGENNSYFNVGRAAGARGEMFVYDGDVDLNAVFVTIAANAGSTGLMVVSGGRMTVTNENSIGAFFRVGASGLATMIISNKGYVASDRLAIGYGAGGFGTLVVSDGGTLEMTGANYFKAGLLGGTGFFTNRDGGTLRFTTNTPDLQFTNPGVIQNAAIEFKGVTAADIAGAQLAKFAYSGTNTLRLSSATNAALASYLFGAAANFAILDLVSNSAFRATSLTIGSGGKVTGAGTILANNATNFGTLAPGHSPGTLTFSSNLVLDAASVLNIELGGTNSVDVDHLVANGFLSLGGTLNVTLINGYIPTSGDKVDILDWGSIFGNFSTVNLPSAQWSAASLYTDGTLLYAAIPEPRAFLALGLGLGLLLWSRRGTGPR